MIGMADQKKSRFTIRPAEAKDIPNCTALDHSLETQVVWQVKLNNDSENRLVSFQTLRLPRAIRVEYPRTANMLQQELVDVKGVLVAEAEEVLLGYIQVVLNSADQTAWIRNLAVGQLWRRRKIGSALLDQAIRWAQHHHSHHITLETTTRSYPAIQFALARGMLFCGFNDRYYTSQDIAIFFGQNL